MDQVPIPERLWNETTVGNWETAIRALHRMETDYGFRLLEEEADRACPAPTALFLADQEEECYWVWVGSDLPRGIELLVAQMPLTQEGELPPAVHDFAPLLLTQVALPVLPTTQDTRDGWFWFDLSAGEIITSSQRLKWLGAQLLAEDEGIADLRLALEPALRVVEDLWGGALDELEDLAIGLVERAAKENIAQQDAKEQELAAEFGFNRYGDKTPSVSGKYAI